MVLFTFSSGNGYIDIAYYMLVSYFFFKVSSAYPGLPGCVTLSDGLVVGGDGFTHSNMDGCIESAKAIAAAVVQYVSKC